MIQVVVKSGGCDIHPNDSIKQGNFGKFGLFWVNNGTDFIPKGATVAEISTPAYVKTCKSCNNTFIPSAIFIGQDCERCHKRKNVVGPR